MRIAVTGATGRVGGRVVRLLTEVGGHEVRALSSRNAPYDDPAALRTALTGVDTLVFVSSDGEAARVVVHHRNVLEAAAACAVRHLVFLSGLDVARESPFCYAFTNGDTERLLQAGDVPYSVARASLYAEFLLPLVRQVAAGRSDRVAALPAGDARVSVVAQEDVARCLVALALNRPTLDRHDCTGPDSLPLAAIAAAAGHRYADTTPDRFAGALLAHGEEPWWTYAYTSMFASIRQHRWQATSPAVAELTGRPPIPLARLQPTVPISEEEGST